MAGGIYTITNLITSAVYVGSAMCFEDRWKAHRKDLAKGKHVNIHLQRSYAKHGVDAFKFEIAEELGEYDRAEYFASENALMDKLRAQQVVLYNIAKAQGGWSFHDDETKAEIAKNISKGVRRFLDSMTSIEREEYRKLSSERQAKFIHDNPLSDTAKAKISQKLTGIQRSNDTKQRMSIAQSERMRSDEEKERARQWGLNTKGREPPNKGCNASAETRLKQSLAKLGKPMSEENKALRRGKPASNRIAIVIEGINFPSMAAAAKHFNRSMTWVYTQLRNHG